MKTKITHSALIEWLVTDAQMEAKNWSEEFRSYVESYYKLMPSTMIAILAHQRDFEIVKDVESNTETNTVEPEVSESKSQYDMKSFFKDMDHILAKVSEKRKQREVNKATAECNHKCSTSGDSSAKESEIKEMLEKAFPNAIIISPSDLKAMKNAEIKPHTLDELVEGLGLKDLLEPITEEEANKEELAESESFVSSLIAAFETDEIKDYEIRKQIESNLIDFAQELIDNNDIKELNSFVSNYYRYVASSAVAFSGGNRSHDFRQILSLPFLTKNLVSDEEGVYNKILKLLPNESICRIKTNINKHIENMCKC